jgi:hypothetical protein
MINEQKKSEIKEMIISFGGPMITIEHILNENRFIDNHIIETLDYIASIRCIDEWSTNDLVNDRNLSFKENKFFLIK